MVNLYKARSIKGSNENGKRFHGLNLSLSPIRLVHEVRKEEKSRFMNPFLSPSNMGFMAAKLLSAVGVDRLIVFFPLVVILGAIISKELRFENDM